MQRTRCYYFYDGAARCNKREPGSGCDALDGFNLAEYHVPVQADIPFIDIVYTDVPDPHTPLGDTTRIQVLTGRRGPHAASDIQEPRPRHEGVQ
jgi:hypothetical protein